MLSNVYAQKMTTHVTTKTHTYTSQAMATLSSTYILKSQQFPPICDDPLWLYISRECKGNLTDLRRELHLSLDKGNPK
jgi:hypothetical protein